MHRKQGKATVRYHYDWEFKENGITIKPISLGMVSDDNRELYIINTDEIRAFQDRDYFSKLDQTDLWLQENVFKYISEEDIEKYGYSFKHERARVAQIVYDFIMDVDFSKEDDIQFWGYFCSYDHVCLSQLFGRMIDLPPGMPMWTNDLMTIRNGQQWPKRPAELSHHHALMDAKFQKLMFETWSK